MQPESPVRTTHPKDNICDARIPTSEEQVLSIRALRLADRKGVDAINTFGVSAGRFALFRVVSRRQIQCFPSSSRVLSLVRFPAAPQLNASSEGVNTLATLSAR
jgi:hypothetical protein